MARTAVTFSILQKRIAYFFLRQTGVVNIMNLEKLIFSIKKPHCTDVYENKLSSPHLY